MSSQRDLENDKSVHHEPTIHHEQTEAVVQRCSVKKVFLKILQNSQKNTCARVSFLIKLEHLWWQLLNKLLTWKLITTCINGFKEINLQTINCYITGFRKPFRIQHYLPIMFKSFWCDKSRSAIKQTKSIRLLKNWNKLKKTRPDHGCRPKTN